MWYFFAVAGVTCEVGNILSIKRRKKKNYKYFIGNQSYMKTAATEWKRKLCSVKILVSLKSNKGLHP